MVPAPISPGGEPRGGWLISLLFWSCLFSATALYGAVVLSPKVIVWLGLRQRLASNQWRLVEREQQVSRLKKVIAAQRSDPEFLREQAHAEFDLPRPGEQQIPVEPHLTLQIGRAPSAPEAPLERSTVYINLLRRIADSQRTCDALLAIAAGLVLFAFSFLYERSGTPAESQNR